MAVDIGGVLWTCFIGLFIYYIYRKLRQPFDTIRSWGVQSVPCYPLIGNFSLDLGPYERDLLRKYKQHKVIGLQAFRFPHMLILDRELIKRIMVKDFYAFTDRLLLAINPPPLNSSLFSLSNDHWKHVRSVLSPTFTSGKLKGMQPLLDRAAQNAIDFLNSRRDHNEPIVAKEFFTKFTIDAVASTLFGLDVDSHKNQDHPFVIHALDSFNTTLSNPVLLLSFVLPELMHMTTKLGSFLMRTGALQYYRDVVDATLKDRAENKTERQDFLQNIMNCEISEDQCKRTSEHQLGHKANWSEKGLTKSEIQSNAVAFMAAGFETTATTLHMLSYCLATHPEVQEKVYAEIKTLIDVNDVTYEDLSKFLYLEMCILETLRMFPPVGRVERLCTQTVDLDGIVIPKGTQVVFPMYALGMDPDVFPEPEKFRPERFSTEEKAKRNAFDSIPFGAGPRNCAGMRLAWQEMKLLMVKLLQNFTIECSPDTEPFEELKFQYKGFLMVDSPIKIKILPR